MPGRKLRRALYLSCSATDLPVRVSPKGLWNRNLNAAALGLVLLLILSACGGGNSGGGSSSSNDSAPTFHSVAIIWAPLPQNTMALNGTIPANASVDCYPGSTVQLYGIDTIFPANNGTPQTSMATNSLQWSSSNTNVATVSASGVVSCQAQGSAQINVNAPQETCSGGTCKGVAMVTVGNAKHTITLSPTSVSLSSGQSQQMTVTLVTETAPGVSTQQDLSQSIGGFGWASVNCSQCNAPPIDTTKIQNGTLVAQGSGTALLWFDNSDAVPVDSGTSVSNFVTFTSK